MFEKISSLLIVFALIFTTGCALDKLRGLGIEDRAEPAKKIVVTEDTALTQDFKGVQFIVKNGAILDLLGHTVDGQQSNGRIICVLAEPGASVINGSITRCDMGVLLQSHSGYSLTDQLLNADLERQREITQTYIDRGQGHQLVSGVTFEKNTRAIYVQSFTREARIIDNEFLDTDLMGIYLDRDSHHALVQHNTFNNCGYGRVSLDRECIAVDASSHNLITENRFKDAALAGITLYKNCGENQIPRPNGANDNSVINNHFERMGVGINVSSRVHDRVSSSCRDDDPGDIVLRTVLSGNTFDGVKTPIIRNDVAGAL